MFHKPLSRLMRFSCIAFLFFLSWLLPWTRQYWDVVDRASFHFLNHTLLFLFPGPWFWSIANNRWIDVPMFFTLFLLPLLSILDLKRAEQRRHRLAQFLFSFFYLVAMIFVTRQLLRWIFAHFQWYRMGPSLFFEDSVRLSALFPDFYLKDASHDSFPGDHATVLLVWFGFLLLYAGRSYALWGVMVVCFFSLPRLIAGAHWISDILCGSILIAMLILTGAWIGTWQQRVVATIEKKLCGHKAQRYVPFIPLDDERR